MFNRKIEIAVGLFVVLGVWALFFLALQVSGITFNDDRPTYRLYAQFNDIGGLNTRSRVTLAGVTVGQVRDIRLDPKTLMAEVEMAIFKDVNYIPADSAISIRTAGLLGENYLSISVGGDIEVLQDGDSFESTSGALNIESLVNQFVSGQK
ncbi:outer membrane lipid asymmetry maintenance protein MlaD [Hahella sp. SMD15-11]|uniref:Outer membrane lipid asymmetry maintenance protein MlaD n=1 Tax=Thermohahella caldifontis TaxID=3142973 RepID=A0AB39UZ85_9GAMM